MNTTYYIPIKSVNLAHYFSMGIVCPANYILNRNDDIQSQFANNLLLSTSKFTQETNCTLEIVFNEKEERPKKISPNFYVFDMPLAISRIKSIIFNEERQRKNTIFNITSGAAFLPSDLIWVDIKSKNIDTKELFDIKYSKSTKDWTQSINKFNRVLGGIALMSMAKNETEDYPPNYFNTLSNFNKLIASQLPFESNNKIDYLWAFNGSNKFKKLYDIIYSPIDAETLDYIASNENVNLKTRNGLYIFDDIPEKTTTYLAAILASYGPDKRKQIDSFISDFKSGKFSESRKEGLALIFGINKGYSAFRNKYKTQNFQVDIKFRLDSQLDYYTIESIYQFVFYGKSDSEKFDFIDSWCPKFKNPPNQQNTFRILDKDIISTQKKTGFSKSFQDIFKKYLGNRIKIYEKITAQLKKWQSPFTQQNDSAANQYFETELNQVMSNFAHAIYQETKKESNQELVDLQQEIKQKDIEIQKLKKQIKQQNQSIPIETKKIEITGVAEPIEIYSKGNSSKKIGGLFQDSPHLSDEDKRSEELYNLKIGELKKIAKKLNIKGLSKYTTKNRQKLVDKIIKIEHQN